MRTIWGHKLRNASERSIGNARFDNAVLEAVRLTNWYAKEHVVLCLLPAFVIAGAMAVYIGQGSVMRYIGPQAPKAVALGVASISGTLLAVCSCTAQTRSNNS